MYPERIPEKPGARPAGSERACGAIFANVRADCFDCYENENLAYRPEHAGLVQQLSAQREDLWRMCAPPVGTRQLEAANV